MAIHSSACTVGLPAPPIYQIPPRFGNAGTTRLLGDHYHIQTVQVHPTVGLEGLAYPMKNTVKLLSNSGALGVVSSPRLRRYKGQSPHSDATETQENFPCRQRYENS